MLYEIQPTGPASTQSSYTESRIRPKRKISCAAAPIAATLTISFSSMATHEINVLPRTWTSIQEYTSRQDHVNNVKPNIWDITLNYRLVWFTLWWDFHRKKTFWIQLPVCWLMSLLVKLSIRILKTDYCRNGESDSRYSLWSSKQQTYQYWCACLWLSKETPMLEFNFASSIIAHLSINLELPPRLL